MRLRRMRSCLVLAWIVVVACGPSEREDVDRALSVPQARVTEEAIVEALRGSIGDRSDAVSAYAGDAIYVDVQGRLDGRAAIDELKVRTSREQADLEIVKWDESDDLAWVLTRTARATRSERSAYVLTVLRRYADGALRVVAEMAVPVASRGE